MFEELADEKKDLFIEAVQEAVKSKRPPTVNAHIDSLIRSVPGSSLFEQRPIPMDQFQEVLSLFKQLFNAIYDRQLQTRLIYYLRNDILSKVDSSGLADSALKSQYLQATLEYI